MAASNDLKRPRKQPGTGFGYPVKAGVTIFGRTLVGLTATGLAVPAGHADAVILAPGLAEERYDNSAGADGDLTCETEGGVYLMPVTGDPDITNQGDTVYALDDETLQLTNAGGELPAGTIKTVDAEGVWVEL